MYIYVCTQAPATFISLIPCTISRLCLINTPRYNLFRDTAWKIRERTSRVMRQREIVSSFHEVEVDAENRLALDRAY